jgi:hypothetical protein
MNVGSGVWGVCRCGGKTLVGAAFTGDMVEVCTSCGQRTAAQHAAPRRPRTAIYTSLPTRAQGKQDGRPATVSGQAGEGRVGRRRRRD